MYGYFRPYEANLTHRERQLFNSYYCRVCYCLRIIGGQIARFCTTYDAAVYALILALQEKEKEPPVLPCERVGKRNLEKFVNDERGLKLARLSLISVGEKFRDDRLDENTLKHRLVSAPFTKVIDQARSDEPELAKSSALSIDRINELQDSGAALFDVFGAYGEMASTSFSQFIDMTSKTEELIRSISEYNFLVDMVVDYDEDYKNNSYNGLKKEGYPTFADYYNHCYLEFMEIANKVCDRLRMAILDVRDDSKIWSTLFKIIMHALDTVLPAAIVGEDVEFHYFKDLFARIDENMTMNRDIKRLGLKHEKD